ncbi:hypothetical protein [Bythopirellula polymerisocia]|uniref:Uncharacterized protein n=1 Tax=Bythopirellula polymerisocia TaxID=2528003 RepID=A0A5C6CMG8_9BACT|nr:hypothetical protein [Bythopirellula polymerisocia]TWU25562.1 hypothetical protein Pla144_27690 [Bythopirellula polymerisocia]
MRLVHVVIVLGSILSVLVFSSSIHAQFEADFTEFQWVGGTGSQIWQNDTNWDLAGFPNDTDPLDMDYPTANVSMGLGTNLNVSVGTTPVTIAGLTMGGTSGAVTTEISSDGPGGQLVFKNYFVPMGLEVGNDADFENVI